MSTRDPQLASLTAQAITHYDRAHQIMGCVLAVEDGEMSINEARRWLELDEDDRLMAEYGPDEVYIDQASEWLQSEREERK